MKSIGPVIEKTEAFIISEIFHKSDCSWVYIGKDDREIIKICRKIDDFNTRITISAERSFIKKINGNCFTPLAAFAKIKGKKLTIIGRLFSEDGKYFSEQKVVGSIKDFKKIGKLCATKVLKNFK